MSYFPMEEEEDYGYGELMTVDEFIECVDMGVINDYDGSGYAVIDEEQTDIQVLCSDLETIPVDATHIMWYNK